MIPLKDVADAIAETAPRKVKICVELDPMCHAVRMGAFWPSTGRVVLHTMAQTLLAAGRVDVVSAAIRNFVVAVEHEMPLSWWGMSL